MRRHAPLVATTIRKISAAFPSDAGPEHPPPFATPLARSVALLFGNSRRNELPVLFRPPRLLQVWYIHTTSLDLIQPGDSGPTFATRPTGKHTPHCGPKAQLFISAWLVVSQGQSRVVRSHRYVLVVGMINTHWKTLVLFPQQLVPLTWANLEQVSVCANPWIYRNKWYFCVFRTAFFYQSVVGAGLRYRRFATTTAPIHSTCSVSGPPPLYNVPIVQNVLWRGHVCPSQRWTPQRSWSACDFPLDSFRQLSPIVVVDQEKSPR
jgi:hypothetical protein